MDSTLFNLLLAEYLREKHFLGFKDIPDVIAQHALFSLKR